MKKLHLNKIFHWLYAFLMFYPLLGFFGFILITTFNPSYDVSTWVSSGYFTDMFNTIVGANCISRAGDFSFPSIGASVLDSITSILTFIGFDSDITTISGVVYSLFTHWTIVSLFYLLFDVLMLPINIAHHWIDKGSDRL